MLKAYWTIRCLVLAWVVVSNMAAANRKYPLEVHQMFKARANGGRKATSGVGTWTPWSTWTPCSRSCGGGVATQTRVCQHRDAASRRRRRAASNKTDADNLTTQMKSQCIGVYKRFHMCNEQTCLPGAKDFRQLQCEAFNRKQFMGRSYFWEPYLDGESKCELNCRPVGFRFYATLNKSVVDGTSCRGPDPTKRWVCVSGQCKHVGCDGVVGSLRAEDACGVCGGDNSTCRLVSGLFTRPQLPVGYNLIAQVPRGACNLSISELKNSRNYLALRRHDGTYVINGNWAINWSGEYDALGTKFSYRRQEADVGESIAAAGPLSEPVDLMVIYQQPNPGIKYEYMLPMTRQLAPAPPPLAGSRQPAIAPPLLLPPAGFPPDEYTGKERQGGDPTNQADTRRPDNVLYPYGVLGTDTQVNGQGRSVNHVLPGAEQPKGSASNAASARPARTKKRKFGWRVVEYTKCSKQCGGGLQTSVVSCVREHNGQAVSFKRCSAQEMPPLQTIRCNVKPCLAEWVAGEWSDCSVSCGEGVQTRDVMCKQEITSTLTMKVAEGACLSPLTLAKSQSCQRPACETPRTFWQTGMWSACSAGCGEGTRSRTVECITSPEEGNSLAEDCIASKRPVDQEVCQGQDCFPGKSTGESGAWMFTDWTAHCSEACGTGVQTRRVMCTGHCDANLRPDESRACSSDKHCGGKWFTGPWGHCSARCGPGKETRSVVCLSFVRGQHRVAPEVNCAAVPRPDTERSCEPRGCANEWFATDWTQCSKDCGGGMQWRQVRCLDESGRPSEECPEAHEPSARRMCNAHHCVEPHSHHRPHPDRSKPEPAIHHKGHADSHHRNHGEHVSGGHHRGQHESQDPVVLSVGDQAQPGQNDEEGGDCQDKFPNCHLVVQSRLCRYKYYRSSCCVSCENKP